MTALAVGIGIAAFAGCGGGEDTTVIQTTPAPTTQTTTTTTAQAKEPAAAGGTEAAAPQGAPPDVTGLTLPEAKKQLSAAGFKADVSNTDTTFGIIVEKNFTVCEQSEPKGEVVPILAQKYGC